ncbi:hypothetical protein QMK17_11565 [Rhodococcus sp. G-MC3]|uniref:hypothetical protein n=1 Tax=Rhodococcus sp. G-MC3 TaxID=3046209 RepID=UPI0024B95734|nr:hypothetical protein [Rhodococcus sp. G-MC3]MDJ0393969.1 hypothetical protein [Rhodococcus sp. G-MC3]
MRSKIRFNVLAVSAVAALALISGCSSDGDTDTAAENVEACTAFASDQNEFVGLLKTGPGTADGIDAWTAAKGEAIDRLHALPATATGSVSESLTKFVDGLPEDTLSLSDTDSESGKAYVANAKAIASACESDGTAITLDELPLTSFSN